MSFYELGIAGVGMHSVTVAVTLESVTVFLLPLHAGPSPNGLSMVRMLITQPAQSAVSVTV